MLLCAPNNIAMAQISPIVIPRGRWQIITSLASYPAKKPRALSPAIAAAKKRTACLYCLFLLFSHQGASQLFCFSISCPIVSPGRTPSRDVPPFFAKSSRQMKRTSMLIPSATAQIQRCGTEIPPTVRSASTYQSACERASAFISCVL